MVKTKEIEQKIYSIVLSQGSAKIASLWLGLAFDLDDAIIKAKQNAISVMPEKKDEILLYWNAVLFSGMEIPKEEKEMTIFTPNALMRKIVETHDKNLHQKTQDLFSKYENKYLTNKLKL